jgi:dipeptidyl aminopeptidase/acylaminoacyl peptidase
VVDFFGPTDFLAMDANAGAKTRIVHGAPDSPESRLIGGPITEYRERVVAANPITYITEDCPPFFIVHGDEDDVVPVHQSQILQNALVIKGIPSTLKILVGGRHGFKPEHRAEVMPLVEAFLNRYLKGSESLP